MNEKELKENIDKIKQLLILPGYDKIDAGVELVVSLEEPKIFELLFSNCKIEFNIEGGREGNGGGGIRPVLNDWMKQTVIDNGKLKDIPTGYYIFLSLLLNLPDDTVVHETLKLNNIVNLSLKKCHLQKLPSGLSKLKNLKILDISHNNNLSESNSDLSKINNLEIIIDHETPLSHSANPKYTIKYPDDEEIECSGCSSTQESIFGMAERYDGYYCSCDEQYNNLWFYCQCCGEKIAPIVNDYSISEEDKLAEYDLLYDETYHCDPRESSTFSFLNIDNNIVVKSVCNYCKEDLIFLENDTGNFIKNFDGDLGDLCIPNDPEWNDFKPYAEIIRENFLDWVYDYCSDDEYEKLEKKMEEKK